MTKYYRVRTPEQWDWLMEHLELEYPFSSTTFLTDSIFMDLKDDQQLVPKISIKSSNINKIIEVSKLMEDEKMENEDYVTLKGEDLLKIKNEDNRKSFTYTDGLFDTANYFKELRIPKSLLYPKVRMSVAEKKEFDNIDKNYSVSNALDETRKSYDYPALHKKIYEHTSSSIKEFELEFASAWVQPSLIEVIPEKKYWVKCYPTDDCYFYKYAGKIFAGAPHVHFERFKFNAEEIKQCGLDNDLFEKVEVKE